MLLTIYNLPYNFSNIHVKSLIEEKCGITQMLVDNIVTYDSGKKKVTVGLSDEGDAALLVRKINGLYIHGVQLYVEDVRKKMDSEQPYRSMSKIIQEQRSDYDNFQPSGYSLADNNVLQTQQVGMVMPPMTGFDMPVGMYYMPSVAATSYLGYGSSSVDPNASVSTKPQPLMSQVRDDSIYNKSPFGLQSGQKGSNNRSRWETNALRPSDRDIDRDQSPPRDRRDQFRSQNNNNRNTAARYAGTDNDWVGQQPVDLDRNKRNLPDHTRQSHNAGSVTSSRGNQASRFEHPNPGNINHPKPSSRWEQDNRNWEQSGDSDYTRSRKRSPPRASHNYQGSTAINSFDNYPNMNVQKYDGGSSFYKGSRPRDHYDALMEPPNTSQAKRMKFDNPQDAVPRRANFESNARRMASQTDSADFSRSRFSNSSKSGNTQRYVPNAIEINRKQSDNGQNNSRYNLANKDSFELGSKEFGSRSGDPRLLKGDSYRPFSSADRYGSSPLLEPNRPVRREGPISKVDQPVVRRPTPAHLISKFAQNAGNPNVNRTKNPTNKPNMLNRAKAKNNDNMFRFQTAALFAKDMISKYSTNGENVAKVLVALKTFIKSRIDKFMGKRIELHIDNIKNEYRRLYPKKGDATFFREVMETVNNIAETNMSEFKKELAKVVTPLPNVHNVSKQNQPQNEAKVPKYPGADKTNFKIQKKTAKLEFADEISYELEPTLKKAVDAEIEELSDLYIQRCLTATEPEHKVICDSMIKNCLPKFKQVVNLHLTKRLLDIRTSLNVRIWGVPKPPRKPILEEFLQDYGVLSLKKSDSAPMYLATIDSFENFDRLLNLKTTVMEENLKITFKPLHLTGPPEKKRNRSSKSSTYRDFTSNESMTRVVNKPTGSTGDVDFTADVDIKNDNEVKPKAEPSVTPVNVVLKSEVAINDNDDCKIIESSVKIEKVKVDEEDIDAATADIEIGVTSDDHDIEKFVEHWDVEENADDKTTPLDEIDEDDLEDY